MSGKRRKLAVAAFWLFLDSNSGYANWNPLNAVLNGPATINEIYSSNGKLLKEECTEVICAAMDDIAHSFEIMDQRDIPSGNTLLDPEIFNPGDYNDKVWHLLRAYPDRRPAYCRILTKIAHHYDRNSESSVGRWDIEIAALISPFCARAVVAALPRTKAVDDMLAEARGHCLPPSPEPGCQFMVRCPAPSQTRHD